MTRPGHCTAILLGLLVFTRLDAAPVNTVEQVGRAIFFDTSLSEPAGQACATCHAPETGWTGPDSRINATAAAYPGAVHGRAGNRKPPSAAYATLSPALHFDRTEELFLGGNFWDGRATGWLLGNPAADQAQGPFLNPVEQNLPEAAKVVEKVCQGEYGAQFRAAFGTAACRDTIAGYNAIAQAVAAFEASGEVNAFSSKYDHYLRDPERYPLSEQERRGLSLFEREDKGNCAACHPSQPGEDGSPPLFTDFSYDNLGVPRNPANPWYAMPQAYNADGRDWVDPGLGGFLETVPRFAKAAGSNTGKHRVPTLRNVDKRPHPEFVKAFGHNGYFKSLEAITHFYNTRDTLAPCDQAPAPREGENCWPRPEVAENVNREELGDLGLTSAEEADIVAFMRTLSDGWTPAVPQRPRP